MSRYFVENNASQPAKEVGAVNLPPKHVFKNMRKTWNDNHSEDEDPFPGPAPIAAEKFKKYRRGNRLIPDGIKTRVKKKQSIEADKKIRQTVQQAARSELLLPEEAGFIEVSASEDSFRVQQRDIAAAVDITSATKYFSLNLPDFGPYKMNYSRDGRYLLLGGRRGHVAAMDWMTKKLSCEMNVMESVHDLCWLHIPTMFATAQKEWVHIYDTQGIELHCIKKLSRALQLEFLPYHFLLVASNEPGFLSWLDVSVGKMVTETYTNAGRLNIMCQNPYNAVIMTGHANGTVSMWSPNVNVPLVRMLCHPHPIRAVAVDTKGQYMATASVDRTFKIWDVRTYKCLQTYKLGSAANSLHFSQRGLLSVGLGNVVEVYKDCCTLPAQAPYIRHKVKTAVSDLQFCSYEDVLGVGHGRGFASILVPGAGEPNFDAFEGNPFMTKSQRREMEVKALLEKVQPELITLDQTHLGKVNVPSLKEKMEKKKALLYVKTPKIDFEPRMKTKGRGKSAKVFKRKKGVAESKKREFIKEAIKDKARQSASAAAEEIVPKKKGVLDRFRTAH